MTTPAAGWYPDPAGPGSQRWWDGVQWSQTTRPLVAAPPPLPTVPQFNPGPQYGAAPQFGAVSGFDAAPQQMSPYTLGPASYVSTGSSTKRLQRTNPLGFAGVAVGLGSLIVDPFSLVAIVAIIFCIIGLIKDEQIRRMGGQAAGRGWLVAGLVIGCLSVIWYWGRVVAAVGQAVGAS